MPDTKTIRVVSWNVNGLRACANKGFFEVLNQRGIDILGVQEVRAQAAQLPTEVRSPSGWRAHFSAAERPGYSGVGLFSRVEPDRVETSLGETRFDAEGRVIIGWFGKLIVASIYFPKGSGTERDNSRVPYKLDFYRAVYERIKSLQGRNRVLVVGDFNTAHQAIDLARPKDNAKTSGFLAEERAEMSRWLSGGWVDAFRVRHPDESGHYTWWRQWGNARANNIGWRIDYVLASKSANKSIVDAFIWPEVVGSDHCPVGVDLQF